MPTLQELETPIDKRIVEEVIALTPETWTAARLEVTYSQDGEIERYSHVISSLEDHGEPVVPSDELFDLTRELGVLFRRYGKHWRKATYVARLENGGGWKYSVDFEYSQTEAG
jgi:hypothetical protein